MKHKIFLTIIFIGLGAVFSEIKAQQMLITIDKPFVVKSLSGVITNANGETMRELTVT